MERRLRGALEAHPPRPAPADASQAATALILCDDALDILFIQRAEREGDPWSNQMALPGGRKDPTDVDLTQTARRETMEEVGVCLTHAELWGALPSVLARPRTKVATVPAHGELWVTPYVFRLPGPAPQLQLDPREVQDALWIPAQELIAPEAQTHVRLQRAEGMLELPAWRVRGRVIWGLTYFMVQSLLEPRQSPSLRVKPAANPPLG